MKAAELMVGDWAFIKDYPIKSLPQKVRPEHFVRSLVEFEPIPLTQEILEKNGWVYEHFGKRQEWWLDKTKFPIVKHSVNSHFQHNGIVLSYVHQLQHAMRLFGIEKEITL